MQSLLHLPPATPLQAQLLSTPKFSRSRQQKSKSSIGHYQSYQPFRSEEVSTVFQQAKQFIKDVDSKISQFKKFNENKVTMRYEYLVKTMEKEINVLKTRLAYEETSKNPTKQYMKGLLDQLLVFKKQNEKLKEEIKSLNGVIKTNEKEIKDNKLGIQSLELSLKGKVERLPSINYNGSSLSELIVRFIEEKHNIDELLNCNSAQTKLEKYLKEIQKQKPSWDVLKLLIQIDKWVENQCGKATIPHIDIWKIRYGALERFNKIRGDSLTPTPTQRQEKSSSVDTKGRVSMKEQRVETNDKDNNRYEKPKLRKLKEKVLSNFSSKKLASYQKLY